MESSLLRLVQVSKHYAGEAGPARVSVLHDLTESVAAGESVAIVGPSGSGKSTLLNLMGALDRPSEGQVLLNETDLATLGEIQLAEVRRCQIGFIFQSHYLLPQCTVLENVLVPTLAGAKDDLWQSAPERARRLLERVGLGKRLSHRPGQLSGGECQRVAVVRALINQPKLLLADEPTGALDWASAQGLGELLAGLNQSEGVTLVVATHALDLAQRMERRWELREGTIHTSTTQARRTASP